MWDRIPVWYSRSIQRSIVPTRLPVIICLLGTMWRGDDHELLDGRIMPRSCRCWNSAFAIFSLSGFRRRGLECGNTMCDMMSDFTIVTNLFNQTWKFLKKCLSMWITHRQDRTNSCCVAASDASHNRCICVVVNQTTVL